LLEELARRLSKQGSVFSTGGFPSIVTNARCHVGRWESTGGQDDLLLRVAVDLYTRWLSDSTYWEQVRVYYELKKSDLVGKVGETVGAIFEEVSKNIHLKSVGDLVKSTLDGLASANRDLKSGGLPLAPLQADQARDLLQIVHNVTQSPAVLIVDQWEKSGDFDEELNLFDGFLRHLGEWPPCHIFLGMIPQAGKPGDVHHVYLRSGRTVGIQSAWVQIPLNQFLARYCV
jgi:hypothetical protein